MWEERSYAVICVSSVMLYGAFIQPALLARAYAYRERRPLAVRATIGRTVLERLSHDEGGAARLRATVAGLPGTPVGV